MDLPDGYVIPYNEKTELAYRTIFEIAVRLAKKKKEQVFCEVTSYIQKHEGGTNSCQISNQNS